MKHLLKAWKNISLSRAARVFLLKTVNDQFLIGVTGVIFNDKNEVLLVKHTYRRVAWSLPGGFLQQNEHPKAGLAREIEEETGFKVHIIKIIKTKVEDDGRLDISYFGVYKSGKFRACDEVTKYKFVPVHKLPKLIDDQYDQILEGYERKKAHDRLQRWRKIKNFLPTFLHKLKLDNVK